MIHRVFSVALLTLALSPACKQATQEATNADENATAEEATGASGSAPCDDLKTKLCETAGKESATCESATSTIALLPDSACRSGLKDFTTTKERIAALSSKCDALVAQLCEKLGKESDACAMVTSQTKSFDAERCVVMLDHVDEIVADLKQREEEERKANLPLNEDQQKKLSAGDAPAFGPENAKVTLVEFSDFECPFCSKAAHVTEQVKAKYGSKVRFIFRQFPLSFHDNAQVAAEASLAAHQQGKFWEFHDKMFENQRALDRASLEEYAASAGLDMNKFKAALDSNQYSQQVKDDLAMGTEVAVQGTPTLFVNGKRIPDPTNFALVEKAIEEAL